MESQRFVGKAKTREKYLFPGMLNNSPTNYRIPDKNGLD